MRIAEAAYSGAGGSRVCAGCKTCRYVEAGMNAHFAGRLAFVSGAASGIGRAVGIELGRRGMQVAVADIDLARAEQVAAEIGSASAMYLDVAEPTSWADALDLAESRHGPLAVMVSNAGIAGGTDPVSQTSQAAWEWSRSVNLDGNFYGLTQGLDRIAATGLSGHLVATSSLAVINVKSRIGVYAAMKAGVLALCEALRDELVGSEIGISVLLPGPVQTRLLEANASRSPENVSVGRLENQEAQLRNGLSPEAVAMMTAEAIGTDEFWLFPNRDLEDRIDTRMADMKKSFRPVVNG